MESFHGAQLITQARLTSGLTQAQLAESAGTSQAAVARYEAGKVSPSVATLTRLLRAAGFELKVELLPCTKTNLASFRAQTLRAHRGEINKLAHPLGVSNIRIFGSVARGDDDNQSDVDLLVDFDLAKGMLPIVQLQEALTQLFGFKVEICPQDALKSRVLKNALRDAVPL